MSATPLISVIIPVYNVEKYVASSIDSVLRQEVTNFEILLVDDGSTDGSASICDDYATRDSRIRVIHKSNGGVSSARNMGLDNARGEWIAFLDADDWFAPDTFERCRPYMDDYQVIRFSITDVWANGRRRNRRLREAKNRDESLRQVLGHRSIIGIGGTMYRRSLFEDNGVRFSSDITYGEDWLALGTLIYHSTSVKTLSDAWCYLYNRYNETSCTNSLNSAKLIQSLVVLKRFRDIVGVGYEAEFRRSRCYRVDILRRHTGDEESCRALISNRDRIDMLTLGDILRADIHIKLRFRLLKFWFGSLRRALRTL